MLLLIILTFLHEEPTDEEANNGTVYGTIQDLPVPADGGGGDGGGGGDAGSGPPSIARQQSRLSRQQSIDGKIRYGLGQAVFGIYIFFYIGSGVVDCGPAFIFCK